MAALEEDNPSADVSGDAAPTPGGTIAEVQRMMGQAKATGPLEGDTGGATAPQEAPQAPPVESQPTRAGGAQAEDSGASPQPVQPTGQPSDLGLAAPAPRVNPFLNFNLASIDDPETVYHATKSVTDTLGALLHTAQTGAQKAENVWNAAYDPNAISQSIHNIWSQNTAQAAVMRAITTEAANLNPEQAWAARNSTFQPYNQAAVNAGNTPEAQKAEENRVAGAAPGTLLATANPANAVLGGNLPLNAAAFVAPSVIQALASSDPNERDSAMVWAALTGSLLGAGHLGPFKDAISAALPKWGEVQKGLQGVLDAKRGFASEMQTPGGNPLNDWIENSLGKPVFEGTEKTIAKGIGEGGQLISQKVTPEGDIIQSANAAKELQAKAFKKLGVDNAEELAQRVADNTLTPKQAKFVQDNWRNLGMIYDLKGVYHGSEPLRDPRVPMQELDEAGQAKAQQALNAASNVRNLINHGPLSASVDPIHSIGRQLIGLNRGTQEASRNLAAAMYNLAGHVDGKAISKAIEGVPGAYDALPPEGKVYASIWSMLANEQRLQRAAIGKANAVAEYLPRIPKVVIPPKGSLAQRVKEHLLGPDVQPSALSPLRGAANKHRSIGLALDSEGKIIAGQAHETLADAQKAVADQRSRFLGQLGADKLAPELEKDPEVARIRELAQTDGKAAAKAARDYAKYKFPDFEDNAHLLLPRAFGNNISDLHAQQSIDYLSKQISKVKNPETGDLMHAPTVVRINPNDTRQTDLLRKAGYDTPKNSPHFQDVIAHPDYLKFINDASSHIKTMGDSPAAWRVFNRMEADSVRSIMYSPAIHAWNLAGRMGTYAGMNLVTNPIKGLTYLMHGKALLPGQMDAESQRLRQEAANAGVILSSKHQQIVGDLYKNLQDAMGDSMVYGLPVSGDLSGASGAAQDFSKLVRTGQPKGLGYLSNLMWRWASDFSVAVYHIEKNALIHEGLPEDQASLWAMKRANTWAGHVAPEDINPLSHMAAKSLMFAPNWWRTWVQIFAPHYENSGVAMSAPLAKHIAKQEAAAIAAFFAMQKITGNALNYVTSGHFQNQNQPGNQDSLELTRPGVIQFLQKVGWPGAGNLDPATGRDRKTGAVMTLENPVGRVQKDVEEVGGFQSGHAGAPKPEDVMDGMAKFLISRLSPAMNAAAGIANIDPYQSVRAGFNGVPVDPTRKPGQPGPGNVALGLLQMMPGGSQIANQVIQATTSPHPTQQLDQDMPWLTNLPKGLQSVVGGGTQTLEQLASQFMLGINPPHPVTPKTPGDTPTTQDMEHFKQNQDTYNSESAKLGAELASGTITPQQWLKQQQQLQTQYGGVVQQAFKNAPEHTQGAAGLAAEWNSYYDKATKPDGSIDYAELDKLQAQFKANHTSEEMMAMQTEMNANRQANPALDLYHRTISAYQTWQERWAAQNGVDVNTLRADLSAYGASFGNTQASQQFKAQHSDVARYEIAKRTQWDATPAGLMYALYFDPQTASRYMHGVSNAQVEQRAEVALGQQPEATAAPAPTTATAPATPTGGVHLRTP